MQGMIFVATHRPYEPFDEKLYKTVLIGNAKDELKEVFDDYYSDDDCEDNISDKNSRYCELTALYYAWKHKTQNLDYYGLCHYRRFLCRSRILNTPKFILDHRTISDTLRNHDAMIAIPNYLRGKTVKENRGVEKEDWDKLYTVIRRSCPEYEDDLNDVLSQKTASLYNLFVMKKELADEYCDWLFSVLFELETITDYSQKDNQQTRILACHAEFLQDVWMQHHGIDARRFPIAYTQASIKGNAWMNVNHTIRGYWGGR